VPRLCANLTHLFTELSFLERFAAAKDVGFDGVEVPFPYDVNAQDIVNELTRHDLKMVVMNCPPPNYTGGDQGFAALPGLQNRFQRDFKRALRYAKTLGAQHLHVMAGVAEGADARAVYIENLHWAATEAPKQSLTIAPMSSETISGYFLNDFDTALEIITLIDAPNLRLQFDALQASKITGDVATAWDKIRDVTVHVQAPQDHFAATPDTKVFDISAFLEVLDRQEYAGWVSAAQKC